MVKAKENKKVVGSYKTIKEAAEAMFEQGKAASVNAAKWNIYVALRGHDNRTLGERVRNTAYGYSWSKTESAAKTVKATSQSKTKAAAKSTVKSAAKSTKTSTKATKAPAKKAAAKKTSKKSSK